MKRYLFMLILVFMASGILAGCGGKPLEEGLELLESGDYEASAEKFEQAIEDNKNPGDAYRGIGIAKWELGQYEESRDAFLSALENDAERTGTIYNFLGNCEMQLGNPKAALDYYNLGIACEDSGDEMIKEMKFNKIAASEQCGQWENAKAMLQEYLEEYPEDARAVKEAEFFETQ